MRSLQTTGLASGRKGDGSYERVWFQDLVAPDEVAFESGRVPAEEGVGGGAQDGRDA